MQLQVKRIDEGRCIVREIRGHIVFSYPRALVIQSLKDMIHWIGAVDNKQILIDREDAIGF